MIMRRMSASTASVWLSRFSALVLAAAAMGSAVAWGLKLRAPLDAVPLPAAGPASLQVDAALVARALGAADAGTAPQASAALAASRMVLVGVLVRSAQGGAALIALDGKAPKPVAVGARVGEDWVLASVAPRRAVLRRAADSAGESFTLELPLTPSLLPKTPSSP